MEWPMASRCASAAPGGCGDCDECRASVPSFKRKPGHASLAMATLNRKAAPAVPEICAPPPDMKCSPGASRPTRLVNTFLFGRDSATLTAAQKAEIDATAASWHAAGGSDKVRVDGSASAEGACAYNWGLSRRRAQAIATELGTPSDGSPGVPTASVEVVAHGETAEGGPALEPNRNATISMSPVPKGPPACLPRLLGSGRGCASGTDFTHFDFPDISWSASAELELWAGLHLVPFRQLVPNTVCEFEMLAELDAIAGDAGVDAFNRFAAGIGGVEKLDPSTTLGRLALTAPSFLATVTFVRKLIEAQLRALAPTGAIDPCLLRLPFLPPTHFRKFGPDPGPLQAVIGGTQGESLSLTRFTADPVLRTYSLDLQFIICDDFGVDEADLYSPGLISFWVLQHERSATEYRPFVNQLELPMTLSGTF